jgi:hypothetical protein
MLSFVHIRDPRNTGDMASCPAQYFDFGTDQIEVLNYSDQVRYDSEIQIYGGGTMVNWLNSNRPSEITPKVIWGAGSSRHGETQPWPDPDGFSLIGTREWTPEREKAGLWAPCPSCMSYLFDLEYPVTRPAVAFVNASETIRARYPAAYNTGLPMLDNTAPMEDIVAFLGSAETVVTNSYHGMTWASWLGRKVEVHGYSSKFHNVSCETLAGCRAATMAFHERVMALVGVSRAA